MAIMVCTQNDGIKKAWDKRSGNTGDINLILLSLLKEAGVIAYPCLISTRNNGKINTAYPFLDQFNALYVYVPLPMANLIF